MKKLLALLIIVIFLFCSIPFSASAENNVAEIHVKSTPNWAYDYELSDKFVFPDYFTVGRTISMNFSLTDVETLVLDLEQLEYVSSAGLRVFLKAQKLMNTKGTMKTIHVNATIMEVFDITGFVDILTIE